MGNNYLFIINKYTGERITAYLDESYGHGEDDLKKEANADYPDAIYTYGDDAMLDKFLSGKIYVNGQMVERPVIEYIPTKAEQVAQIKDYYDKRFDSLDKAVLRRRLANTDISDLQTQYKTLQAEMVAKIKEVK